MQTQHVPILQNFFFFIEQTQKKNLMPLELPIANKIPIEGEKAISDHILIHILIKNHQFCLVLEFKNIQ